MPYNFLDPDEGTVVPKAFHVASGHLNPHWFYYPSLWFYLLAALYWAATPVWALLHHADFLRASSLVLHQGAYFLLGRLLSVAFGTASVYLVYRLGRDAYSRPVGLLAAVFLAVEPLHVKYSHIAVTDVPATAFSLLALVLLLRAAQGGGRRWLAAGAVAAGLATSTKYNLGSSALPAVVAAWYVCCAETPGLAPARRLWAWARLLLRRVAAPMLAGFIVASPFVVLDAPKFLHDFARQNAIMQRGWLGFENAGNGYWYNFNINLAEALGLVLLGLAVAGLLFAFVRRSRLDLIIAPYLVFYFLYISSWKELADRYLLPLVPLLLLLAARLCVALFRVRPAVRTLLAPGLAVVVVAAVVLPLTDTIAFNQQLSRPDVRLRAMAWVEANIPAGSRIVSDTYGPPLVGRKVAGYYRAAGMDPVVYRLLALKLPVPGQPDPWRDMAWLRQHKVRYVIVTSAVYGRIKAAAQHYPTEAAFYERLDHTATLLQLFRPMGDEQGPVIKVYRLPPPLHRHHEAVRRAHKGVHKRHVRASTG